MIPVYYAVLLIVLLVAGPVLLTQKKARAGLSQKLGLVPDSIKVDSDKLRNGIWIHAVSVGEFNAIRPLVERLHERLPEVPILVSTTTLTGQTLAKERVSRYARVFYFPLDIPFATRAWLDALSPELVIIAETEIWPGFLSECKARGIKTMCVNGRMSPRSFKSYRRYKFFFGQALRCYSQIGVQSENEATRYRAVGGDSLPVEVTGNMKLDGLSTEDDTITVHLQDKVGIEAGDFVVVAGSTHEGEESALIAAHARMLADYETNNKTESSLPRPRLIIAPRHPERFQKVIDLVANSGFQPRLFSQDERFQSDKDVYVLDGLGQLARYYCLATVAFVGGTLKPVGGHNLLEPYAYSVPTVCGPHVHKTRDIANALSELNALVTVENQTALTERLSEFQRKPETAIVLGKKGRDWISENQGAVERNLKLIVKTLGSVSGAKTLSHG